MITSLGIDHFWDHISQIERQLDKNTNFPPYDIIRHDEDNATVEVAVAGYKRNDLSITVYPHPQNYKVLEIASSREPSREEETFEHRGIARRSFRTRLPLTEDWDITGAFCEDGILSVNLVREVPEEKKPKTIEIK